MANNYTSNQVLDDGAMLWGFVFGFIVSGVVLLMRLPRRGLLLRWRSGSNPEQLAETRRNLRTRLNALAADPVSESIAEGKAAARKRQTRLLSGD